MPAYNTQPPTEQNILLLTTFATCDYFYTFIQLISPFWVTIELLFCVCVFESSNKYEKHSLLSIH